MYRRVTIYSMRAFLRLYSCFIIANGPDSHWWNKAKCAFFIKSILLIWQCKNTNNIWVYQIYFLLNSKSIICNKYGSFFTSSTISILLNFHLSSTNTKYHFHYKDINSTKIINPHYYSFDTGSQLKLSRPRPLPKRDCSLLSATFNSTWSSKPLPAQT